jgi:SAM-dependent methyltransferase
MPTCNICERNAFIPGMNERMSRNGLPPLCAYCRSLERHRVGREILATIRYPNRFSHLDLLQFSADRVAEPSWFNSVERSLYGKENSIDIQDIRRADESYGFVICSHVIEHVPDHRKAVKELTRILAPAGLMFLAYPAPIRVMKTRDWGYPDPKQHEHYRVLGRDFEAEYPDIIPNTRVIAIEG